MKLLFVFGALVSCVYIRINDASGYKDTLDSTVLAGTSIPVNSFTYLW